MSVNKHRTLHQISYDIVLADLRGKEDRIKMKIKEAEEGMRAAEQREKKQDAAFAEYGPAIGN